ncbi:MAG: GNAT family N-acetyltransferase [Pseudonocardia sp.]
MVWKIDSTTGGDLDPEEVIELYRASGLGDRRPIDDVERFGTMLRHANLVVACRHEGQLVGIARGMSDFSYVTYLSDIAVRREYQRSGIGRELIEATRVRAPNTKIVLLSAPAAVGYYPRVGFTAHSSAWVLESGAHLT